jgi:hypothetical protein
MDRSLDLVDITVGQKPKMPIKAGQHGHNGNGDIVLKNLQLFKYNEGKNIKYLNLLLYLYIYIWLGQDQGVVRAGPRGG